MKEVCEIFKSSTKKIYTGIKILFRKYEPINNIEFPTEIQFIYCDTDGKIKSSYTYNLSNISFNDITKKQLKINVSGGTLIDDRIRDKTYVISDVSNSNLEELIVEKLLNSEN